jgi:hypothetical protein
MNGAELSMATAFKIASFSATINGSVLGALKTLLMTSTASSTLPCWMSQRGVSGRPKIKIVITNAKIVWQAMGKRHAMGPSTKLMP